MTTAVKSNLIWKTKFADYFVFLWILAISLFLSQQRLFPYIFDDEYGVLGSAAVFAGLDWSSPAGMPFYGFLLSLVGFPVYWLDLEPTTAYRTIIAGNALFIAISALLAVRISRHLFQDQTEFLRISIIIAAFSYPAILHSSALAMSESALLFCFFLIAYHLTSLIGSARILNAIFLGVGIGLSQYAHQRGIAFVIASVLVLLYTIRTHSIPLRSLLVTAVSALITVLILGLLKSYLFTGFYTHEHASSSLSTFMDSRLDLLNLQSLIKFLAVSAGQFTYLITSSFGLLTAGFSILFIVALKYFPQFGTGLAFKTDQASHDALGSLCWFVLLSVVIMLSVSVLAVFKGQRADHIFYGRYNEVLMPAIIIASLTFLTRLSKKTAAIWVLAGFLLSVLFLILVSLYPASIFQRTTYFLPIPSWLVYSASAKMINPKIILFGLILAFSVLAVSFAVSRKLFITVLIAFFTSTAFHNFAIQHKGADMVWGEFSKLPDKLGTPMKGMNLQVFGTDWTANLKGEALQFAFPRAHVRFHQDDLGGADAILDYSGTICSPENTVTIVDGASFCVLSESLKNAMNITPDIPMTPTPADKNSSQTALVKIEVPDKIKSNGIRIGLIDRFCELVSKGYYTRWFRHCKPVIGFKISQAGLPVDEHYRLRFYITGLEGTWLHEWRVDIDNQQLLSRGELQVSPKIRVPAALSSGVYTLNVAIMDESGHDFKSNQKIELYIR